MDSKKKLVSRQLRIEAEVELREGRFHLIEKTHGDPKETKCDVDTTQFIKFLRVEGTNYVYCWNCDGNDHEEASKSSPIKHPLHSRHTLMFVRCAGVGKSKRKCLCCEDPLHHMFYCCPSCNLGINLACVDKQTLITIDHPKRHEHTLTLFPRQTTLTCNVCALDDSTSPIYICPACDFVVHKRCIGLPWSIRISRHPHHRISFTSSFAVRDLICNICRRKINNDYGGYICNKEGCSYFAHSRCATGPNVWDGQELEGMPEEVEEVKPPFERLGDGTIRHFSHEHHPLKLNIEDTTRDYDEYRSCEACVMPIYFGNFYSCLDCSFILHEDCANMATRIYNAIHPHPLLLRIESPRDLFGCSACSQMCSGFFYDCGKCDFKMHIQCAMICEPFIHNSHMHPLFLTSAPEECRSCTVCKDSGMRFGTDQTFNCIKSECDFSLCFKCVFLPQKVRYKHDKHFLTLFYGEETRETQHWCDLCEKKIKPGRRFYMCEECCVNLHTKCLLGRDMNLRFGSYSYGVEFDVLPNNRMTRPICSGCHKRCIQKMVFQCNGKQTCSRTCMQVADLI